MKKVLFMVAAMLMTLGASAQHEVGSVSIKPMVGMTVSNLTKQSDNKAKVGVVAGFEAEYQISSLIGISAGVDYSMQGCKFNDFTGSFPGVSTSGTVRNLKTKLEYINVPILANVYIVKGLAVKAGIQPGFLVRAKNKADFTSGTTTTGVDTSIKDYCKKFDFSIPVGLSYEYANFVLDARYNIGLTKVNKDGDSSRNSVFMFTLGYRFDI